jgi:GntR family transcriptional regulator, transcriptional repressor for pyruvate dehydrogenase complex
MSGRDVSKGGLDRRTKVASGARDTPRSKDTSPARLLPTIKKTSVSVQAAEAIKALIVAGELKPGDPLPPEREMAAMLGISRPSVREAIKVLTAMNVVEAHHGGGTYLTSLHPRLLARPINFLLQVEPTTFLALLEVREVLEVGAARLAAPNMTDEVLGELEELVTAAAKVMGHPGRFAELDFDLHSTIVEATGNPIYLSLYESVSDLSLETGRRAGSILAVRRRAHRDHLAIVAALRQRNPEQAAQAMNAHLESLRSVLVGILAREERA